MPTVTKTPTEGSQNNIVKENQKTTLPPLILESHRHRKTYLFLMVKNEVDFRLKLFREGGIHISIEDANGYRKRQDRLQENA